MKCPTQMRIIGFFIAVFLITNTTDETFRMSVLICAVLYSGVAIRYLSMEKLPSNLARWKSFALYNKVADSYHAEYITCIHRTARFHVPRRENINTLDVSAASIAYVRATNISNWFTRESYDKSVCYNFFYLFLYAIKRVTRRTQCLLTFQKIIALAY